jgi:hypothetical protein
VAQSSDNPNLVVVAAQAFVDASGNCGDSHAWASYSHDGGQHRKEEIIPGATAGLASGDGLYLTLTKYRYQGGGPGL